MPDYPTSHILVYILDIDDKFPEYIPTYIEHDIILHMVYMDQVIHNYNPLFSYETSLLVKNALK